jgi:hypothetical protein
MPNNQKIHRILKADFSSDGQLEFLIEVPFLRCSFELERLIGTSERPGTPGGIVRFPNFEADIYTDSYA